MISKSTFLSSKVGKSYNLKLVTDKRNQVCICQYVYTRQGWRNRVLHLQFLADQLTPFQPEAADYAHHNTNHKPLHKGSNNYLDKKRGDGVSRKSTLGHVTKDRYYVKFPQFSTRGGRRSKTGKIWYTQLLNDP